MIINIKTLSEVILYDYDYEKSHNHRLSFLRMMDTLSKSLNTTTVQCVISDVVEGNVIYKDDLFYMEKWETFFENANNQNNQNEIYLYIRPMFEVQTVKNPHLYAFLSEYDQEIKEWDKNTIVWFDVVGNRIYFVRYTEHQEVTDMFSIQIDKFIDELKQLSQEDRDRYYSNYKMTSVAKERLQYIVEGRVI